LLLGVLSLTALGFCVAGTWVALAAWRRVADHARIERSEGRSRAEMMSLGGVALGLVFTLATIWNGLPVLLVSHLCAGRQ
jgi:hypothetical protein